MKSSIQFGGVDSRAVRMLEYFQHGFWLSDQTGIGTPELQQFLRREYIEKGRSLFGRGTSWSWKDFRTAADGRLDDVDDAEIEAIIIFAVQRVRNYGNILQLKQGRYRYATVVAITDNGKTCSFCRDANGQGILVFPAAQVIEQFASMKPGHYAEALHSEKATFPPFHRTCRCEVQGVGVLDDPQVPAKMLNARNAPATAACD